MSADIRELSWKTFDLRTTDRKAPTLEAGIDLVRSAPRMTLRAADAAAMGKTDPMAVFSALAELGFGTIAVDKNGSPEFAKHPFAVGQRRPRQTQHLPHPCHPVRR